MSDARSFEALVLPHLDSAFNLARWLLHDEAAAEDAVQEAALRAIRHYATLRGNDARPWFLTIVRNVCFSYLHERTARAEQSGLEDDALESLQWQAGLVAPAPEDALQGGQRRRLMDTALQALSPILREVIVLRELEGMTYEDIARVAAIPLGTVMSRLSRARANLKALLVHSGAD